ncbi:MAG: hypothetical protein ISS28_05695 [Candidatus Cloacimonetes bacterium]|nr:hypothetical protein [Candidatus Cloacimonadota bacterium]MBL7086572.1 hypothetical protein [Candidatus Cloacimonadota bacterium]
MECKTFIRLKFCLLITILIIVSCSRHNEISIRKFPYPYRAAFTICSDIDDTNSIEEFLAIQKFINGIDSTEIGRGLGLEIGNSFWMFNQFYEMCKDTTTTIEENMKYFTVSTPDFGISYFDGLSDTLSPYADIIAKFIRAGYIDCLHSYGHFKADEFDKLYAVKAINQLEKDSLYVDVFIDHGGKENTNNIGNIYYYLGDNPECKEYHTDLTLSYGIKFLWWGQVTHCIGQDGKFSPFNQIKQIVEFFQDRIFHPEYEYYHDNKLVHITTLNNGQKIFEFVRFINLLGYYDIADEQFLINQIGPKVIDKLIHNEGYLLHYTHLGANQGEPYLTASTLKALYYIKQMYDDGELFVTTTSKLLNYYVHQKYLNWHYDSFHDSVNIIIDNIKNEVEGEYIPNVQQLEGITFYVPENKIINLYIKDKRVNFVMNKKDYKGHKSISIQWRKLKFPL